jgi:flagellar FliJ protein
MKTFSFRLEKLLQLRAYYEKEAELDLARAIAVLSAIELQIEETARKRVEAAALRFLPGKSGAEIYNTDLYIIRLDQLTGKLFHDAAKAELVVAEKRERYLEASQKRKVLDKLKEKRFELYKKECKAGEIKNLDDAANGSRARLALH